MKSSSRVVALYPCWAMSADAGRRTATGIVLWALVVAAVGVAALFVVDQHHDGPRPAAQPRVSAPASVPAPSTTVVVSGTPPPAVPAAAVGAGSRPSPPAGTEAPPPAPATT